MANIVSKRQMYNLLTKGMLGNTLPQFFAINEWADHAFNRPAALWGIRSTEGNGDSRSFMNVKAEDVLPIVARFFPGGSGFNVSEMVDQYAALRCQVVETAGDMLLLEYVDPRADLTESKHPWRDGFRFHRKEMRGTAAKIMMSHHMSLYDYYWIEYLLDQYPEHVIEFTICNRELGREQGCNTIIWEVRAY